MTTRTRQAGLPREFLSVDEILKAKRSMLAPNGVPMGYGQIETVQDALEAAKQKPPRITLRAHILWDCPADEMELERVLQDMRAFGAAMVTKVEVVTGD